MYRMTVAYEGTPDDRFDFDYYTSKHVPMVAEFIGESCVRTEVTRGVGGGAPGQPAPWLATVTFWLEGLDGMNAAMGAHGGEIMADIKNYTDLKPTIQVEEVVKVAELV